MFHFSWGWAELVVWFVCLVLLCLQHHGSCLLLRKCIFYIMRNPHKMLSKLWQWKCINLLDYSSPDKDRQGFCLSHVDSFFLWTCAGHLHSSSCGERENYWRIIDCAFDSWNWELISIDFQFWIDIVTCPLIVTVTANSLSLLMKSAKQQFQSVNKRNRFLSVICVI